MTFRDTNGRAVLSFLVWWSLLVAPAYVSLAAQEIPALPGTIKGQVVDEEGRPVVSATVVVVGFDSTATTGADGRFSLAGIPAGSHRLEASCTGFTGEIVDSLTVSGGETVDVVFRLTALQVPLQEIVVTAKASILRDQPAAAVALDRKAISELPHFGDDLYRAINVLPGTSGGDISARFSVRGGLYDESLVTLDDQEVMDPFHLKDFQGVFSILDPEMIGGVELTPGGFTAKYGDRMTGVLDMVTRLPTATRTGFGISLTTAWAHSAGRFAGGVRDGAADDGRCGDRL